MKLIFVCFLLLPIAVSADQVCDQLLALEEAWNAEMPRPVDEHTELIQVRVCCETETISYTKRILIQGHLLPSGAKERKQRQHAQLHCNKGGLASQLRWTAMDLIYDVDLKYLFALTTTPASCYAMGK